MNSGKENQRHIEVDADSRMIVGFMLDHASELRKENVEARLNGREPAWPLHQVDWILDKVAAQVGKGASISDIRMHLYTTDSQIQSFIQPPSIVRAYLKGGRLDDSHFLSVERESSLGSNHASLSIYRSNILGLFVTGFRQIHDENLVRTHEIVEYYLTGENRIASEENRQTRQV